MNARERLELPSRLMKCYISTHSIPLSTSELYFDLNVAKHNISLYGSLVYLATNYGIVASGSHAVLNPPCFLKVINASALDHNRDEKDWLKISDEEN